MLEALASTQSAATGLLEQMRGVRRKLACETTTNRQYIERNFEDIYQDACVRFEGRLTNVVSHPEETAVLERLAVAQRLDDWWPETVRYGARSTQMSGHFLPALDLDLSRCNAYNTMR